MPGRVFNKVPTGIVTGCTGTASARRPADAGPAPRHAWEKHWAGEDVRPEPYPLTAAAHQSFASQTWIAKEGTTGQADDGIEDAKRILSQRQ